MPLGASDSSRRNAMKTEAVVKNLICNGIVLHATTHLALEGHSLISHFGPLKKTDVDSQGRLTSTGIDDDPLGFASDDCLKFPGIPGRLSQVNFRSAVLKPNAIA